MNQSDYQCLQGSWSSSVETLKALTGPAADWGPALPHHRRLRADLETPALTLTSYDYESVLNTNV